MKCHKYGKEYIGILVSYNKNPESFHTAKQLDRQIVLQAYPTDCSAAVECQQTPKP